MTETQDGQKRKSPSIPKMLHEALRDLLPYTNLPYQLAATILLFFGIGYGLDAWLKQSPTFTVIFSLLGVILGMVIFIKTAMDLSNKQSTKKKADDTQ